MKVVPHSATILRTIFLLVLAATAGALSGAAAAFVVMPTSYYDAPPTWLINKNPTPVVVTSTEDILSLVRIQPQLAEHLLPSNFLTRRSTPVASVYRKARGVTVEERSLTDERLISQAVALTTDGWFVTTASAVGSVSIADLTIWHQNKAYAVSRGLADKINGTVYLKIDAKELNAPAFGDVLSLVSGSAIWTERRSNSFAPTLITSLYDRTSAMENLSSEISARRILLDGTARKGDLGSPAWNPDGVLIGIVDSAPGDVLRIIPSTSIAASFSSFLTNGAIKHASLGVRSVDLVSWRIDGDRGELPNRGAWLRDDRKTGKLAVAKDSSAFKSKMLAGDVILSIERDILDGTRDLGEILSEYRPGATVVVRVNRGGKESDVTVTLGTMITGEPLAGSK